MQQAHPLISATCYLQTAHTLQSARAGAEEGPASIGAGARDMRPVVICGFGELGQSVVNMLESPLSQTLERGQVPYVAFDLQPARIKGARAAGFNVLYG